MPAAVPELAGWFEQNLSACGLAVQAGHAQAADRIEYLHVCHDSPADEKSRNLTGFFQQSGCPYFSTVTESQ